MNTTLLISTDEARRTKQSCESLIFTLTYRLPLFTYFNHNYGDNTLINSYISEIYTFLVAFIFLIFMS